MSADQRRERVRGFQWTVDDETLITQTAVYGQVLVELGRADPRVVVVTADVGNSTRLAPFRAAFPDRYFDVGIAEQAMIGFAAGLAAAGLRPIVSAYAQFAVVRAAEFVRNDVAYNGQPVIILGTLAGTSFGQAGATHHSMEDLALLRTLPGMTVVVPCDGLETGAALRAALSVNGPVYIRAGRGMEPAVPAARAADFAIGRAATLRAGGDAVVIANGPCVHHALTAAARFAAAGVEVRVLNVHTLKPLDEAAVLAAAIETRRVVVAEDHGVIGGLGSAVAELVARSGRAVGLRTLGLRDRFYAPAVPDDLLHQAGIDADGIAAALEELLRTPPAGDGDWDDDIR
jgi:transketolase